MRAAPAATVANRVGRKARCWLGRTPRLLATKPRTFASPTDLKARRHHPPHASLAQVPVRADGASETRPDDGLCLASIACDVVVLNDPAAARTALTRRESIPYIPERVSHSAPSNDIRP